MAKPHGAREQKKLAKRKAKQKAKHQALSRRHSLDPSVRLKGCEEWPILACVATESLWESGLGMLAIVRRSPEGDLIMGSFLVDALALGVKDAFWRVYSGTLENLLDEYGAQSPLRNLSPEHLAKIVFEAVEIAKSSGFLPHRDHGNAKRLLGGIDPSQCSEEFDLNPDAVPYYFLNPRFTDRATRLPNRELSLGRDDMEEFELTDDAWEVDDDDEPEYEIIDTTTTDASGDVTGRSEAEH